MGLPKIASKNYEIYLPSNGTLLKFRPYLSKEERLLLEASQEGSTEIERFKAILNVVQACILTDGIEAEDMPVFDFEYLYLQIHGKSVGEEAVLHTECDNPECSHKEEVTIDFTEIDVKIGETHTTLIKFFEDDDTQNTIAIEFSLPTIKVIMDHPELMKSTGFFDLAAMSMKHVWVGEKSYTDFTVEEAQEFIESLTIPQFETILDRVFNQMPRVYKSVSFICSACKKENTFDVEGMDSFFA